MSTSSQARFFNIGKHQYPPELIEHPPFHVKAEVRRFLAVLKKNKVRGGLVDFGSGSGRLTIPLLRAGYPLLAVDLSQKSLTNLQNLAHKLNLKNLKTTKRLPRTPVSAIVGTDILHHLNIQDNLPLFWRSLKKKGFIYFSEPNYLNLSWHIYLRLASSWKVEAGIKQCTYFKIRKYLEQSGFKNIQVQGFGIIPLPLLNWSSRLFNLNLYLSSLPLFKLFSYRFLIFAQK